MKRNGHYSLKRISGQRGLTHDLDAMYTGAFPGALDAALLMAKASQPVDVYDNAGTKLCRCWADGGVDFTDVGRSRKSPS